MIDRPVKSFAGMSALPTLPVKIVLCCIVALLAMGPVAVAQDVQSATVVGTVTDPTGAVVPNAIVTVMNMATNVTAHATTNAEGEGSGTKH